MIAFARIVALQLVLLTLLVVTGSAQPVPAAEHQEGMYILVLESGEKKKDPDLAKFGATLISSHDGVLYVRLPRASAQALCAQDGVAYLQRTWQGEPRTERGERPCAKKKKNVAAESAEEDLSWSTGTYAYDGSGNIKTIGSDTYRYDSAGRLIQAVVGGKTETYRYDSFGNLIEKSISGQVPQPIGVDAGSNRLSGTEYDVAGNVTTRGTRRFSYDSVGMLDFAYERLGDPVRYIYTADDERIAVFREPTDTQIKVRDFEGKVLREYRAIDPAAPGVWIWEQDQIYGEGRLVAAEREQRYGGVRHYHLDHLGSVRMITNEDRLKIGLHDYYPFGNERSSPVQEVANFGYDRPSSMKFTSHERDFTWLNSEHTDYLDYMHARYYDPGRGRFLSVDPLLDVKRSTREPQSWNRYSYVVNNPINRIDPDGRMDGNGMGEPTEWRCPGCTRAEALEQSNQIAAGTAKGAAWSLAAMAGGAGVYAFATNAAFRFSVLMNLAGIGIGVTGAGVVTGGSQGLPQIAKQLATAERIGSALKADPSHRAASFGLEAVAKAGQSFSLKGGDGMTRTLIQAPGRVNGKAGILEYIINKAGQVTHQRFIEKGVITGLPNQKPPV